MTLCDKLWLVASTRGTKWGNLKENFFVVICGPYTFLCREIYGECYVHEGNVEVF